MREETVLQLPKHIRHFNVYSWQTCFKTHIFVTDVNGKIVPIFHTTFGL